MKEDYVLKKITALCNERGWSLYRLAKEADVSYSTLSNTFHRNNVPSVSTLMRICEGFGITLSEFFDDTGAVPKQLTASDEKLLAEWHLLPRNEKRLVITYIHGLLKSSAPEEHDFDAYAVSEAPLPTSDEV